LYRPPHSACQRLDQDVLCHVASAIKDSSLDDDALAYDIRTGDIAAEVVFEDFKARLLRMSPMCT